VRLILYIFLLFSLQLGYSQINPENISFGDPMKIPLISAGSYGELRSNHFHAGVDLKTQQREGIPVYATEDGYVSRIKVSVWGYGKVVYLRHNNGYTTVYAHLQKFAPRLEDFVKNLHYTQEKHSVQSFPNSSKLPVKKGELIAYSGSTGGFIAPHLHYEVRDTRTEHPLNPLHFGLEIEDKTAPIIRGLRLKPRSDVDQINGNSISQKIVLKKTGANQYLTDTVYLNGSMIAQVNTYDIQNSTTNKNGVYKISCYQNDKLIYQHRLDEFSFSESKQINLLIDYAYFKNKKSRYQQLYIPEYSDLSIYDRDLSVDGLISLDKEGSYIYKIVIEDFSKNKSTISIPVTYNKSHNAIVKEYTKLDKVLIKTDEFYRFESDNNFISIEKASLYQDHKLEIKQSKDTIVIGPNTFPWKKKFRIGFKLDSTHGKHTSIAKLTNGRIKVLSSNYRSGYLTRDTDETGTYILGTDSKPPTIKPLNFYPKQWISSAKELKFKIQDSGSGIKNYTAFLDDNWILLTYNPKNNSLTYDFNDIPLEGAEHRINLIVEDQVGNKTEYSAVFFRK
jgi:hypothetical protein